jgi:hypothetical protein
VRDFGAEVGRVEAHENIDQSNHVLSSVYVAVWPTGKTRHLSATDDRAAIVEGKKVLGVSTTNDDDEGEKADQGVAEAAVEPEVVIPSTDSNAVQSPRRRPSLGGS